MKTRRSRSQKRKTTARIAINCTPAQKDAIVEKARAFEQSSSAICLNMLLDAPLPRRRRQPTFNDKALSAYTAATAKVADEWRAAKAELGKIGSNLNQIAYMLNVGTDPGRISNIVKSAIEDFTALIAKLDRALDYDLHELRTMAMEVWGLKS
jgi:hypothetical protein